MLKTYYEIIVGIKTNNNIDIVDILRSKKYCPHNTFNKEKELNKFVDEGYFIIICKVVDYKTFEFIEIKELSDIHNYFKSENIQINIKHLVFGYYNFMKGSKYIQIVSNLNIDEISNETTKEIILNAKNSLFGYIGTFKVKIYKNKTIQHLNFLEDLVWWGD